ncbi:DNA-binding domain-containing protein [Trinickia sp. NRRL B-1857]|uniref:HvfC/BufC N-terminal domain-containing protein n=1 Tax=Trinickia sp. NRRL B-1857 TaxID=3162879 RepID=UPI003D279AFB
MKTALARFQDDFVSAIFGQSDVGDSVASLADQPGFAVYRNTILKGCIDALVANYPTVEVLVGTQWLRSAATEYAHAQPPDDPRLLMYGRSFPEYVGRLGCMHGLHYLAEVAALDRLWLAAHTAGDDLPLDPGALAALDPQALGNVRLTPRASTHWAWSAAHPAFTLWKTNREHLAWSDDTPWIGEGTLMTRARHAVESARVSEGACAFLSACAAGLALEASAHAALQAQPDIDIGATLAMLVSSGAFASFDAPSSTSTH